MHHQTIFATTRWRATTRETLKIMRQWLVVIALLAGTITPLLAASDTPAAPAQTPMRFMVRIENISRDTLLPGPFAPGVWAVHDNTVTPLFDTNQPDRGQGLAALAEDGAAASLAGALVGTSGIASSGVFSIPVGATGPGPILPGDAYEFEFDASQGDYVSLASMLVQTNDVFIAPAPQGIALFDGDGNPISGDITSQVPFWDVGSEMNEAPGMGPNQAPHQPAPNTGPGEGGVSAFTNTTRSLPLPPSMLDVNVTESNGAFTFTITNTSPTGGAIVTPLSPLFYATHRTEWVMFTPGQPASTALAALAEDGNAPALVTEHQSAAGVGESGATAGPAVPGGTYSFTVRPTLAYPNLTIATMVVESNDAFLAFGPDGIPLLKYDGMPHDLAEIKGDFMRRLAVWDAGTEANEVPGVGPNQVQRQAGPNSGPVDPNTAVRVYSDPTNDLAGPNAGGFGEIIVVNGTMTGTFDVRLTNTSTSTVYPGVLTPVAWAIHSPNTQLFVAGQPASTGLERLAEDGNPAVLAAELISNTDVISAGVASIPAGATASGPLTPGNSYTFTVTADGTNRYLSVASMMVPSNDTFFAFEPAGLRIMNADGTPRTDQEIATDIATQRLAWDAGTERNQAGAIGPDQAPRQSGPNTGATEGSGNVILLTGNGAEDPVWSYPKVTDVVRVTIHPILPAPTVPDDDPLPTDPVRAATTFTITLENVSGNSALPSPFAPGAWAVHNASRPFFSLDKPDRGEGLAAIAEDGNPAPLAGALATKEGVASSGVFNTPVGANDPGPLLPGNSYEFQVTTTSTATRLSLATMLVQTNDIFAGPGAAGIPLFDSNGNPISGDITSLLPLWDVGSEQNEAPSMGPNQAPRQSSANTGPGEGGVSAFSNTTRGLPLPNAIVDVAVSEANGSYTFTMTNVSGNEGAIVTPISPVFYATHSDQWSLFTAGAAASTGLQQLAEDGTPAGLVSEHTGATGMGQAGSVGAAPVATDGTYVFTVNPAAATPYMSLATMVVESNDAFLAFHEAGVKLLNDDGSARSASDVHADVMKMLAVWDAGTEANEVSGVGPNQPLRQSGPNVGAADANTNVRIYSDAANDLAGSKAGRFANMVIEHGPNPLSFIVTISNTSGSLAYPGVLTPVAWVMHNADYRLFTVGEHASAGLESLSEDGAVATLLGEFAGGAGVGLFGAHALPVGGSAAGPLTPGGAYRFFINADPAYPYFSMAQMIVPSNDTFLAFGGAGIRLLDANGNRRPEGDIAADITAELIAWDAGTERNQAGAAGPDQAPRQSGPNTGADEGNGTVRLLNTGMVQGASINATDDGVWAYPNIADVLKVTIRSNATFDSYLPWISRAVE